MINQNRTWKLRWKMLALCAVLVIGAATLTGAQERRPIANIQADIEKLQAELRETVAAEEETGEPITRTYSLDGVPKTKALRYLSSLIGVQVVLDEENNSIIVTGRSKVSHENVRELLTQSTREAVAAAEKMETQPQRQIPLATRGFIQSLREVTVSSDNDRIVITAPNTPGNARIITAEIGEAYSVQPAQPTLLVAHELDYRPALAEEPQVERYFAQLAGVADPKILKIYTLPPNATEEEYEKQFTPFWKNFQLRRGDLPNLRCHLEKERLLLYGSAADHERMKDVVAGLQEIEVGEDTETFVTYEFPPPVTASFIAQVLPGVRIIPDESSPNRLIAHGRMFDHALVMTLYNNAIQAKSEEATLFQQTDALYNQQKFDEAKPLLEDFVAKYPHVDNLQFVLYYLGAIAMRNDNAEEAEFYFEQAIRMFPEGKKSDECKLGLAWAKEKIGKQAPAEGYVIKIFQLEHANATEVVNILKQLIPQMDTTLQFTADVQTNGVIFKGTKGDQRIVEALVSALDKEERFPVKIRSIP